MTDEALLPRFVLVPPALAMFVLKLNATPFELYTKVRDITGEDDSTPGMFDPFYAWCLFAAQRSKAGETSNTSRLVVKLEGVMAPSERCSAWMAKRLDSTLGDRYSGGAAADERPINIVMAPPTPPSLDPDVLKRQGYLAGQEAERSKKSAEKDFSAKQWARLCGYARVRERQHLPTLWKQLLEDTNTDDR